MHRVWAISKETTGIVSRIKGNQTGIRRAGSVMTLVTIECQLIADLSHQSNQGGNTPGSAQQKRDAQSN